MLQPGLKELVETYLEEKLEFEDINVQYDGSSGYILINNLLLGKLLNNQFVIVDGGVPIYVPAASPRFFDAIDLALQRLQNRPNGFCLFGLGAY